MNVGLQIEEKREDVTEPRKNQKKREIFSNEPNHAVPSPPPTLTTLTAAQNIASLSFHSNPLCVIVVGRFSSL